MTINISLYTTMSNYKMCKPSPGSGMLIESLKWISSM